MMPTSSDKKTEKDVYANIAIKGINNRSKNLVIPEPVELAAKYLPCVSYHNQEVFQPLVRMNTAEQLEEELVKQRYRYSPFMNNLAPELSMHRSKLQLKEFDWRIQTEEDRSHFQAVILGKGQWEKVQIPHYGGPLGQATTYYRTVFQLSREQLDHGACFVCFRGVDYKAHIFVNGSYLGSHEGFFAPFEFDFTPYAHSGDNTLLVRVDNDYIGLGNVAENHPAVRYTGDKIYAATGPGYDDPHMGWHHCPPGMGIYQNVCVETRSRIHIQDVFVRPLLAEERAEAWIEVYNCDAEPAEVSLELSLYGQNFEKTVFEGYRFSPASHLEVGLGDTFTEARLRAEGTLDKPNPLYIEKGINQLKVSFSIPNLRKWELDEPWLYQLQLKLFDSTKTQRDASKRQFGMRSFRMDDEDERKGKFLYNGRMIRLRGANTMGHEQQCVMKEDWDQLRDDILLAKIAHMNFLRITQRPVQSEVYELCDQLGLLTQTDLPLFGVLRKNQFCEALRQTEEMERLVRSHPCNILVSYINEPFPNAGNKPHRNLTRDELNRFFEAADNVIHLNNPDRVIKRVDGDYDPPATGLPDNHCYPAWYNGHGIDIGRLHKGYWMPVKPSWYYGCGEFGSEGLDPKEIMLKYYPKDWLPQDVSDENQWSPNRIIGAQSGGFHYLFYETPRTLQEWVAESHKHQAWATKIMTEAFRRDYRMISFAIHLFIDAFPSGWMKAIMDVERKPKPAYFAYREALMPLLVNLRTDRFKFYEEEEIEIEAWVCNDRVEAPESAWLQYRIEMNDEILSVGGQQALISVCSSQYQGTIKFKAPKVKARTTLVIRLGLLDKNKQVIIDSNIHIEVFPQAKNSSGKRVCVIGDGAADKLAEELGLVRITLNEVRASDVILIDDYSSYLGCEALLMDAVKVGARAIFLELPEGNYNMAGELISIKSCGMSPVHFAARNSEHPLVKDFQSEDFRLWYDPALDYISPLLDTTFLAPGFNKILASGNTNSDGEWSEAFAAAEKKIGNGSVIVCQVKLATRTAANPVAKMFCSRLLN